MNKVSMTINKVQVESQHYKFSRYVSLNRWSSYWHQINEILSTGCRSVLWIGVGDGIPINILRNNGISVTTLDIDDSLSPDIIGDIINLPFEKNNFELCCAFQVLEHMPYDHSLKAIQELDRVASEAVIISLPNQQPVRKFILTLPFIRQIKFLYESYFYKPNNYIFNGEHYWELNSKGYECKKVVNDYSLLMSKKVKKLYRNFDNPYHQFIVFTK